MVSGLIIPKHYIKIRQKMVMIRYGPEAVTHLTCSGYKEMEVCIGCVDALAIRASGV